MKPHTHFERVREVEQRHTAGTKRSGKGGSCRKLCEVFGQHTSGALHTPTTPSEVRVVGADLAHQEKLQLR
jgi:hypothetical protein